MFKLIKLIVAMKKQIQIFILMLVLTTSCASFYTETSDQQTNVSFQVFYDQLSPYGQWVDYSNYGYIWIPYARENFAPYSTNGYWALTQYGWAWISDYNWGWATFHYGRWGFDDALGWFWIPGYDWGPAWVNWIQADGYYGWEPMGPGVGINFVFDRRYDRYHDHWCFVRERDFGRRNISRYYVNRSDHERIIGNSRIIDRTYTDKKRRTTYVYGPDRESVQRVTGTRISPFNIKETNKPGQEIRKRDLQIYRPRINRNSDTRDVVPSRVIKQDDVKRRIPGRDIPNKEVTPINKPIVKPENREMPPNRINEQPIQRRDINKPSRTPESTPPERNKSERQRDIINTRPTQNQNVSPDRNSTRERPQKATERQEKSKPERSANPKRE